MADIHYRNGDPAVHPDTYGISVCCHSCAGRGDILLRQPVCGKTQAMADDLRTDDHTDGICTDDYGYGSTQSPWRRDYRCGGRRWDNSFPAQDQASLHPPRNHRNSHSGHSIFRIPRRQHLHPPVDPVNDRRHHSSLLGRLHFQQCAAGSPEKAYRGSARNERRPCGSRLQCESVHDRYRFRRFFR